MSLPIEQFRVIRRIMKEKKTKCEACHLRGYNPEYCRWHKKAIPGVEVEDCEPHHFYRKLGKTAAIGAGIGVVSAVAGVAAAPALGVKALIGHALAAKMTAGGGGAAVGGIKVWCKFPRKRGVERTRRRRVLLPLYLSRTP
jgi:hypothetical protein